MWASDSPVRLFFSLGSSAEIKMKEGQRKSTLGQDTTVFIMFANENVSRKPFKK